MKQPCYYMIIGIDINKCLDISNKIYNSYKKKHLPINIEQNVENVYYSLNNKINTIQPVSAISIEERKKILDKLRKIKCKKFCIINNMKISECIKNTKLEFSEIINIVKNFQFPLKSEGFRSIELVSAKLDFKTNSIKRELILDDLNKLYPELMKKIKLFDNEYEIWKESAIWKNISKIIYENLQLNSIEQNNLSAYYVLSNPEIIQNCNIRNILAVVNIINYYGQCSPFLDVKIIKKWEKMLGKTLFNELQIFYIANEILK